MPCPVCAFEPSAVAPPDAVVALRSFPRRYRELLPPPDDRPEPIVLVQAGEAAAAVDAIGADLERVLITDGPALTTDAGTATALLDPGDPSTALGRLTAATTRTATLAEHQPAEAWRRTGNRASGPVTAGDLLREAVHAGVHHLRIAERAVGPR